MRPRFTALSALVLAAACGDDSGPPGSGGNDGSGTSKGVTLTVRSVDVSTASIAGTAPDAGDAYVSVELTLENESDDSLPLLATSFAVKDEGGLQYRGSPLTEAVSGGCESDVSVSPDGEATCIVVFSAPQGADLESLVYEWEDGRVEAELVDGSGSGGGGGAGGATPGDSCAERATGTFTLALSVQLANRKPIYMDADVTVQNGAISFVLTPLATPYLDTGVTPMEPVPPSISVGPFPIAEDGTFTAPLPNIAVPGAANSITGSPLDATVTLQGRACPGGADGAYCGTVSGQVTEPIDLQLDPSMNFFAFNTPGTDPLVYDCAGNVSDPPPN